MSDITQAEILQERGCSAWMNRDCNAQCCCGRSVPRRWERCGPHVATEMPWVRIMPRWSPLLQRTPKLQRTLNWLLPYPAARILEMAEGQAAPPMMQELACMLRLWQIGTRTCRERRASQAWAGLKNPMCTTICSGWLRSKREQSPLPWSRQCLASKCVLLFFWLDKLFFPMT